MTYENKMERAKQLIDEHNARRKEDSSDRVDYADFVSKLEHDGGTSEEALATCSWEDLMNIGLPRLLARLVANIYREKAEGENKQRRVSPVVAGRMSVEELLSNYDPREHDNAVGSELKERTQGKRCIVFNPDGTVNVEISKVLLEEIRDNFDERESFIVDGRPQKTYRVGERPDMVADENPLYPGRMLRPDGTCDQNNRSWDGVPYPVRAIIYLAVTDTQEISKERDVLAGGSIMDKAMREDAETELRRIFTRASLRYDQLETAGNLPSLKIIRNANGRRSNNPALASSGHREF